MTIKKIKQIFRDTAYVRTGGSLEEKKAAEYIQSVMNEYGLQAEIVPFPVQMSNMHSATLIVDGKEIPCKGYLCCGSGEVEGELYYLTEDDKGSLEKCKGKIVMVDGYLGFWRYRDMLEYGAVGFITYDGHINYADRDIDQRELRKMVSDGVEKILGVNINVKDAVDLINREAKRAKITISQEEYEGVSQNVVLDLKGASDKTIVLTAHYDSTSLSQGAYDNMSGSVGLMAMAAYFAKMPLNHSLKFIWCGSEERGLLGAKAYCESASEEELKNIVLNVNLDMIGCIMGKFIACCTSENKLVDYLGYMGDELGFQVKPYQDVYSSDSTPFADKGVPAVSFARIAPPPTATIHNSYDTAKLMKAERMQEDIAFIQAFVLRMASAVRCPVAREMPDNMKEKIDEYLCRKRKKK